MSATTIFLAALVNIKTVFLIDFQTETERTRTFESAYEIATVVTASTVIY